METGIQIYLDHDVISGYISCLPGQRLLDRINGMVGGYRPSERGFLVIKKHSNNGNQTATEELVYIKKANILFVRASGKNRPVDTGYTAPGNIYPYVRKYPMHVECHLSEYVLIGNIYCNKGINIQNLVGQDLGFFPITDARIHHLRFDVSFESTFVAVNKDRILYMEELHYN
jgi:hypothetical protein